MSRICPEAPSVESVCTLFCWDSDQSSMRLWYFLYFFILKAHKIWILILKVKFKTYFMLKHEWKCVVSNQLLNLCLKMSYCSSVTGSRGSSCPPVIFQTKTASCGTAPSTEKTPWPSDLHPFTLNYTKNHVHLLSWIYTISKHDYTRIETHILSVWVWCHSPLTWKDKGFLLRCTAGSGIQMNITTSDPSSEDQLSYPSCHQSTLYSRSNCRPRHQRTSPSTCRVLTT